MKNKNLQDIAPLVTFRVIFGAMMFYSALRFAYNGWIERLYIEPVFFFKFYGFEWVTVPEAMGVYLLFGVMTLSALFVLLGLFYRLSIITFFLSFTYIELMDATNYLNHYYLVCILAFLLIFIPAHRDWSLDVWRKPSLKQTQVPALWRNILILQLTIVYTCAGIAKLNPDWLFRAMPLAIWLPTKIDIPVLGYLFKNPWMPYLFSWGGAIYDLTIAYFLLYRPTRKWAYVAVIGFHLVTWLLFNIGMFPWIMIFGTLIFFSPEGHRRFWDYVRARSTRFQPVKAPWSTGKCISKRDLRAAFTGYKPVLRSLLFLHFALQILLPFRHLAYPSQVLWSEEGYRFSWRVMLVEKNGQATFYVHDPATGRKSEVPTSRYLTTFQEKQMSIQPDMMLQYARFLKEEYGKQYGIDNLKVTVESHVALNGRLSQQFIDPSIDLANISDSWQAKKWIGAQASSL